MARIKKLLISILSGTKDNNIPFDDIVLLLNHLEFNCRIKGSHHIFYKNGIDEIINIQPGKSNKAKPYQVKQIRNLLLKYRLGEIKND
jgi:predicted RNA binding protein YcfA (HicA-like mRNA interferase family)